MDAHSENDPEFREWPPHCVVATTGQQKPSSTLLEKRVVVPNSPSSVLSTGQILLEKQTFSCFSNVNLTTLLDHFQAERYVVYGLVTEVCVKFAVFGLIETGKRVEVVVDAVCPLTEKGGADAIEQFKNAGAFLTTSAEVMSI